MENWPQESLEPRKYHRVVTKYTDMELLGLFTNGGSHYERLAECGPWTNGCTQQLSITSKRQSLTRTRIAVDARACGGQLNPH